MATSAKSLLEPPLLDQVNGILSEKGYTNYSYSLNDLTRRIMDHQKNVENKVKRYKIFGFILLLLIPLFSFFLSFLINIRQGGAFPLLLVNLAKEIVPWLSLILTVLTIINSTLKPAERFSTACDIGVEISALKRALLVDLERMEEGNLNKICQLVKEKGEDLKPIQKQLIDLCLPQKN
ncbi:MAG: hypothetical protein ACYC6G_10715 [Desulfobaccales bacterium]